MHKHTTMTTGRASLCALGEYLRRHCFFAALREQVQIRQKTVRYRPMDKLLDALSGMLCGAKTIAQNNVTIRTDRAVQRAFGRTGCAEQSTSARTLRACTADHVAQVEKVSWYSRKRYGATPRHRFHDVHVCCQRAYRPFWGRCSWHPKPRLSLRTVIPARACWPGSRTAFHRARSCA